MSEIKCPIDLNNFILEHPFENTFPSEDCEMKKAYGDCYHCFASAIAKRDRAIRENAIPKGEVVFDKYCREVCSNCGGSVRCTSVKFCENCGARMEPEK